MTRVTREDLRAARLCAAGARGWFARHGLSWQAFLREGVAAETLRAVAGGADVVVERAIAAAEAREARLGN